MARLCLESLPEMAMLLYLFSLQAVGKVGQRVFVGKVPCHQNLRQGHEMSCVKCQPELDCRLTVS